MATATKAKKAMFKFNAKKKTSKKKVTKKKAAAKKAVKKTPTKKKTIKKVTKKTKKNLSGLNKITKAKVKASVPRPSEGTKAWVSFLPVSDSFTGHDETEGWHIFRLGKGSDAYLLFMESKADFNIFLREMKALAKRIRDEVKEELKGGK